MKKEKDPQWYEHTLKDLLLENKSGYIPIPRIISRILGFNATGMLIELCDRHDYYVSEDLLNEYGEFFYIISDCEANTGLTKAEQLTAIKKLTTRKFIQYVTSRGLPKIRYFKLSDNIPFILKELYDESEKRKIEIKTKNSNNVIDLKLPY